MECAIKHLKISADGTTKTTNTSASFKRTEPQVITSTPSSASIDGLPAELKKLILQSSPDIISMKMLARLSPSYSTIYLNERKAILPEVLLRDIGTDVLPDALAVHKAFQIGFDGSVGRKDGVKLFLSEYKAERSSLSQAMYDSLDTQTLESLSHLQSVVAKIASDFCKTTLSTHPVTGEMIQPHEGLSRNEKRRIYRALYRFEMFIALFTVPRGAEVPLGCDYYFDAMGQSFLFLHIFQIWEVEELACVRDYLIRRYTEIIQECSSELLQIRPKKDLNDTYWKGQNTGYLMSLGLPFLCQLLDARSAIQKAYLLKDNLCCDMDFFTRTLNEDPYDWVYQTDMYIAAEDEQQLLFEDDNVIVSPNAAWPWSTDRKMTVVYFQGHKKPIMEWAYVMWDLSRLKEWGILDTTPKEVFNF